MIVIYRALKESDEFARNFKHPLPETVTSEDLFDYDVKREFDILRKNCPIVFNAIAGGMGLSKEQSQVPQKSVTWFMIFSSLGSKPRPGRWNLLSSHSAPTNCEDNGANSLSRPSKK